MPLPGAPKAPVKAVALPIAYTEDIAIKRISHGLDDNLKGLFLAGRELCRFAEGDRDAVNRLRSELVRFRETELARLDVVIETSVQESKDHANHMERMSKEIAEAKAAIELLTASAQEARALRPKRDQVEALAKAANDLPTAPELEKRRKIAKEETEAIRTSIKSTQDVVELRRKQFRVLAEDIRALKEELKSDL